MTIKEMQERKRELGYSYEKLAELSGLPVGTIQKVLGGITRTPRYDTRRALEAVLAPGEGIAPGEDGGGEPKEYTYAEPPVSVVREKAPSYGRKGQGEYTLEDYYRLPGERHAELIDGVLYDMAAPTSVHQVLSGEIFRELSNYIRQNGGSCIAAYAPLDVQLGRDMVQPDVLVVCDREKFRRGMVYGAPDFVVEILSESTRRKDMFLKLEKYTLAGVREYWLVDPDRKKVLVYDLEKEELPAIYGFSDKVPVRIFEGKCSIDFAGIYEYVKFLYDGE